MHYIEKAKDFVKRIIGFLLKKVIRLFHIIYMRVPISRIFILYQAWSLHYRKEINLLEVVQRQANKMMSFFNHFEYTERLHMFSFDNAQDSKA